MGFAEKPKLPPLNINQIVIDSGITDGLLPALAQSLSERQGARRNTIQERCQAAADIANATDKPVILWCALNDEGDLLESLIPDSVQVSGSNTPEQKEEHWNMNRRENPSTWTRSEKTSSSATNAT